MGGRFKCVLSFFSGKTGGPLPLGLGRGSVSGGGRGEQEGTGLHIPEILKPVRRGNSILRGQSLRHTQEQKDKMECPVLRSVMSNSLCDMYSCLDNTQGQRSLARYSPWGFSRQEYWSGLPCPPPGDLPSPGIKPRSPALQADSLPSEPPGKPKNTGVGRLSSVGLPDAGIEPGSPALQVDSLRAELPGKHRALRMPPNVPPHIAP